MIQAEKYSKNKCKEPNGPAAGKLIKRGKENIFGNDELEKHGETLRKGAGLSLTECTYHTCQVWRSLSGVNPHSKLRRLRLRLSRPAKETCFEKNELCFASHSVLSLCRQNPTISQKLTTIDMRIEAVRVPCFLSAGFPAVVRVAVFATWPWNEHKDNKKLAAKQGSREENKP